MKKLHKAFKSHYSNAGGTEHRGVKYSMQRAEQTVLQDVQSHYTHHVMCKYSMVNQIVTAFVQYG